MEPVQAQAKITPSENYGQLFGEILQDIAEFEAGQAVSVQLDALAFDNNEIEIDLIPGDVEVKLFGLIDQKVPLQNYRVVLPIVGPTHISAGTNALIFQKTT